MPPVNDTTSGREYWRSLDHLADTPEFREFMHREFPAGATDLLDSGERREFLKIMGASMALAGLGLAGCRRWPDEHIVPFANRPEARDPGVPVQYATSLELGGVAIPVLATSFDGRPVKLEGNPDHPASGGGAETLAQASILDLYDPDRSRTIVRDGAPATEAEFVAWATEHFARVRQARGAGLAILSEATSSPSVLAMRQRLMAACPDATWHEYEPISNDAEVTGAELAFGSPYRAIYDLEAAERIVCLDADLLGDHRDGVRHIRGFARGRRPDAHGGSMNRLYAFESDLTLTGANADHRSSMRTGDVALAAAYLTARILGDSALQGLEQDPAAADALPPRVRAVLDHAVADLQGHQGSGLVVAGRRQPPEVHLLAHLMNEALGNAGRTVTFIARRDEAKHAASLRALAGMTPDTLVILGGNPAYDAPADVDVAGLIGRAGTSLHLSLHRDETSELCTWHVNRAHPLESWSDGRSWDGTYSTGQPLILPLFDGRTSMELLALMAGEPVTAGQEIVKRTFADMTDAADEARWQTTLHDGRLPGSAYTKETPRADRRGLAAAVASLRDRWASGRDGWEIVFATHPTVYDGRFANNGWLQELPDPMTRLTWDNAVLMSPTSAATLDVETGDLVNVSVGSRAEDTVSAPALIVPGIAERSVTLHLGYGRRFAGRICTDAGFDVRPLRSSDAMWVRGGADVTKGRGSRELAITQDHHTIDANTTGGRGVQDRLPGLFREATLAEYADHPDFAAHRTHVVHRLSMWEETNLEGATYAWGMSVDLNACVGCGACVVACQAENNIPIVGKDQVTRGREMHWMRIDRYFRFGREDSDHGRYDTSHVEAVGLQPVLCMQCENAPCEQVCPVAATVHDEDGLNVMVYNRCVGTRYCSNNCPYKVRRFNYFDYHRREPVRKQPSIMTVDGSYFERPQATPPELMRMQFNPEVTVRMRGIMEKCTYCIQRINAGKIAAKNAYAGLAEEEKQGQRVTVPDGSITPACAQTCPAEALVFGDLNDPGSAVAGRHADPRSYEMLEELNVKARTRYMAKLRNPAGDAGGGGPSHGGGHGAAPRPDTDAEAPVHA
jgi:molybdopterin-containing oxidoreductase family iron-sulfur binding subunit